MTDFLRKLDDIEIGKEKKINSKDYFELVYLRHRYFRKSTNPSPERLQEFEEIICNISDKIYRRNILIFKIVGFENEDIRSIGRINAVSFISMGGLKENPHLMEKFIVDHKNKYGTNSEPGKRDIFLRESYNISKYLNQRLQEVATFCEVKSGNIIGDKSRKKYFIGNPNKNPSDDSLLISPEAFGYKTITKTEFEKLIKKQNPGNKNRFITDNGCVVRVVFKKADHAVAEVFYENSKDNEFNLNPEDLLIRKESFKIIKKLSSKKKT
jgi:hypothetical protein